MDMIKIDSKEIDKHLSKIAKKGKKAVTRAVNIYVNNMAAETKKETKYTLEGAFRFKNSSTRKYTNKQVAYTKARKNATLDNQISEVGATGKIDGSSFADRKGGFLARQEIGGKVEQIKSGGQGLRGQQVKRDTKNVKPKQVVRVKNVIRVKESGNQRINMYYAVRSAHKKKIPFVSAKFGVFKVNKKGIKRIYTVNNKRTKLSPTLWLKPALDRTLSNRENIFKNSMFHFEQELMK